MSILLAFAIDAWWQERQERQEEREQLSRLRVEFTANVSMIDQRTYEKDILDAGKSFFEQIEMAQSLGLDEIDVAAPTLVLTLAAREVAVVPFYSAELRRAYEKTDAVEELTQGDLGAYYNSLFLLFNHFENSRFLYQQGYLPDVHWQSALDSILHDLRQPYAMDYWTTVRLSFRESLVEAVDQALSEKMSRIGISPAGAGDQ